MRGLALISKAFGNFGEKKEKKLVQLQRDYAKKEKLTGTDRQTGRQADGQDHVLGQADALTKKS